MAVNYASQIWNEEAQANLISPAACYERFLNVFSLISDTLQKWCKILNNIEKSGMRSDYNVCKLLGSL